MSPEYDGFAWFYNRHWGADYHAQIMGILDQLGLAALPSGAAVLDLCCGNGRVASMLLSRGFRVTGLEASEGMLAYAGENAPGARFVHADARSFRLEDRFDFAVSVFESLNHILSLEDLPAVFLNVRRCLRAGGRFVFDLNREPAFEKYWNSAHVISEPDSLCASRASYDPGEKLARCDLTIFRLEQQWLRTDITITQRCHPVGPIPKLLLSAGFRDVQTFDAAAGLGMTGDIGFARTFFSARG